MSAVMRAEGRPGQEMLLAMRRLMAVAQRLSIAQEHRSNVCLSMTIDDVTGIFQTRRISFVLLSSTAIRNDAVMR
jgi:predicted hotdog family 3-hydroxylacyl-ACP dehydratase